MVSDGLRLGNIRQANEVSCIQAWRNTSELLTIAELSARTGLSRPTVDAVLDSLERHGIVSEIAADSSGTQGGRPARRFRFEARSRVVAGIAAAPRETTVLIADLRGMVIGRASRPVPEGLSAVHRLGVLVDAVHAALEEADVTLARLRATCVGVSGIIGHDGKINRSYFVPEWNNSDIVGRISAELGCSVVLENDIKLAAYAEHHVGAAQLASDSVYFQIGENIAFAITIDGRIHQGAHRSAGELASLRGMRWTRNAIRGVLTWQTAHSLLGVVDEAEHGEDAAAAELDAFITDIATRIVTVALVLDPDLIIVGGEVSLREYFMERLSAEIDRLTLLDAKPGVLASSLGQDGTLVGALALAFKEYSAELYGTPGVPVPELVMTSPGSDAAAVGA